jgi:valyl-tRNA synthetase
LFVNLDKFEQGGVVLEELAAPEIRANAPYAVRGAVPLVDQWLFSRLASTIESVNDALTNYRFHEAAQGVYQFFWGDFCDWYIEWVKPELQGEDRERAIVAWRNLFAAFESALRLLHPIMPFLTEELWHQLPQPKGAKSIALDRFPDARPDWKNAAAAEQFGLIQEVVVALRNIRAEMKLDPKKKVAAEFSSADEKARSVIEANRQGILLLASLSELKVGAAKLAQAVGGVRSTAEFDVRIPYSESIDIATEKARLQKEIDRLTKDIESKERQLADKVFLSKAPEKVIRAMQAALEERRIELKKAQARLEQRERGA